MTPVIFSERLEKKFMSCVRNRCKVSDCELKLDGFPEKTSIFDVDCIIRSQNPGRRCDFAIVADENGTTFFLPIEFKTSNPKYQRIKEQLEDSIKFFKQYLNQFQCCPVLVSKKLKPQDRKRLVETVIRYGQGRSKRITHVICNKSLRWDKVKK